MSPQVYSHSLFCIQEIRTDHKDSGARFSAMLKCWLSRDFPPFPTWTALIDALRTDMIEGYDLAEKIESQNIDKASCPTSSDQDYLKIEDLKTVRKHIWTLRSEWYSLGVQLGIPSDTLKVIAIPITRTI